MPMTAGAPTFADPVHGQKDSRRRRHRRFHPQQYRYQSGAPLRFHRNSVVHRDQSAYASYRRSRKHSRVLLRSQTTFVGPLLRADERCGPMGTTVVSGGSTARDDRHHGGLLRGRGWSHPPRRRGGLHGGASDRLSFSLDDKLVHVQGGTAVQDPSSRRWRRSASPWSSSSRAAASSTCHWLSTVPAVVMAFWYPGQDGRLDAPRRPSLQARSTSAASCRSPGRMLTPGTCGR